MSPLSSFSFKFAQLDYFENFQVIKTTGKLSIRARRRRSEDTVLSPRPHIITPTAAVFAAENTTQSLAMCCARLKISVYNREVPCCCWCARTFPVACRLYAHISSRTCCCSMLPWRGDMVMVYDESDPVMPSIPRLDYMRVYCRICAGAWVCAGAQTWAAPRATVSGHIGILVALLKVLLRSSAVSSATSRIPRALAGGMGVPPLCFTPSV
ncbi:hypothetical protein FA95DRAFT_1577512 [Auriscalpium vulgare]|uniref:Uncharacterized protein n=1 Tax=Auriscalpium vulgare TaxID=40419 RepID=A0ACB8R604_9AGAM|nr:hypothetical protein FA95DRAFT_1577512 [Auriscalpium vulgare]